MTDSKVHYFFDPVHGAMPLTDLERDLVDTPALKRLGRIRHLSLAHLVYPSASFSRLSHSLGTCHVAGRLLTHLQARHPRIIKDRDVTLYRVAGLLHDVGHYPFSHLLEHAAKKIYVDPLKVERVAHSRLIRKRFENHEGVGALVLESDPEISRLLHKAGIDPHEVSGIFRNSLSELPYKNLISSDLDADRLDYLLRTAQATGLPYGHVDIDYLIHELSITPTVKRRLALSKKALRSADHFLLARYFDYLQVSYHKTVKGLEVVLEDLVGELILKGFLDVSFETIAEMIQKGSWQTFDDEAVTTLIRDHLSTSKSKPLRAKAASFLERTPPKLLAHAEYIDERENWKDFRNAVEHCRSVIRSGSSLKEYRSFLCDWDGTMSVTKAAPPGQLFSSIRLADEEKVDQLIYLKDEDGSRVLSDHPNSLMRALASKTWYCFRIYLVRGAFTKHEIGKLSDHMFGVLKETFRDGVVEKH